MIRPGTAPRNGAADGLAPTALGNRNRNGDPPHHEPGVRQLTPVGCAPPSWVWVSIRTNWEEPKPMGSNLAGILTETAAEHGDRPALKLDDTVVTYACSTRAPRASRRCCRQGRRAGRPRRHHAPERPVLRGHLLRDPARRRRRRADEPAAQGPRGEVLRRGPGGEGAVRLGRLRGGRRARAPRRRGAELVLVKPGEFEELVGGHEPDTELAERDGRRHRRPALHLRHHRHAEGRRADARQPAQELRDLRAHARQGDARRTSCSARCRCSTPSGRRAGSTARCPSAPACR